MRAHRRTKITGTCGTTPATVERLAGRALFGGSQRVRGRERPGKAAEMRGRKPLADGSLAPGLREAGAIKGEGAGSCLSPVSLFLAKGGAPGGDSAAPITAGGRCDGGFASPVAVGGSPGGGSASPMIAGGSPTFTSASPIGHSDGPIAGCVAPVFASASPNWQGGAPIAGTARNPSALSPLTLTVSDPPTQAEVQTLVDAHNALLAAVLR